MNENQASRTAQYMALFRAIESAGWPGHRLFDDPLAVEFLDASLRRVANAAKVPLVRELICRLIDYRWPGARTSAIARTRLIDDLLAQDLADGTRQVVILGAGFDCRAFRLPQIAQTRVFELDHPATQQAKRQVLVSRYLTLPSHVQLLPIDFNRQSLGEVLAGSKFDGTGSNSAVRTFFLWEGVTNYLTDTAVDATLRAIRAAAQDGRLVFTYVDRAVINSPESYPGGAALQKALSAAGEEWTFGFHPVELPDYLSARGFQLVEDTDSVTYRRRYLPARRRLLRGYEFYRLAVADFARE